MVEPIICVVIDDEAPALKLMEQFISQTEGLKLIQQFRSPVQAIQYLMTNKVDIAFCDIQMPEMNGINMVKVLQDKPQIIFTTAYSEFGADAFEVDAIDYLKKPFSYERFTKAVSKAKDQIQLKGTWKQVGMKMESSDKNYLIVKSEHKIVKVFYETILYIEAFQEYVKIFTSTERLITLERMKNLEALLPSDEFIRVHRSYIISKSKVSSISGNLLQIGENQIPVSREMKEAVTKLLF